MKINLSDYPIYNWYKSSKLRIKFATILYRFVILFVRNPKKVILRNKIRYSVDLTEGIDLSLFLFGNFQDHVTKNSFVTLPLDAVVFDIGANFGVMALQFAKLVPKGHVYAFEPTHYAYDRLLRNLKLNPTLSRIISPVKHFISDKTEKKPKMLAFSSWKVDGGMKNEVIHPVHLGHAKSSNGVSAIRLDDFCKRNKIKRIDMIKIDTDGYDYLVLKGALESVKKFRPYIIFEVGDHFLKEHKITFQFFLTYFNEVHYKMYDLHSGKRITKETYKKLIPIYGNIDVVALPV